MTAIYSRIIIEHVYPEIDCGRYPVKREVGEIFDVWADIFMDGHDLFQAVLCYKQEGEKKWQEVPMTHHNNDRYTASFPLTENTRYRYTIKAWPDPFASWQHDTEKKRAVGAPLALEIEEGILLLKALEKSVKGARQKLLAAFMQKLEQSEDRLSLLLAKETADLFCALSNRDHAVTYAHELVVVADRERARFSAWYEFFPRSFGNLRNAIKRLPAIKEMGFDVVYLPPIHPIGASFRKGKNNALIADEGDVGSTYAIGGKEGGHKEVHPDLGTLRDFRSFVQAAETVGLEVALDFAVQCSPDHPYIKEHPEWFSFRPDGSIKYAENPPKKYQDIVNMNFASKAADSLWEELRSIVLFWIKQGVKIFRVDNPHTKPFAFWEWLIESVQKEHPEVLFLSEAFTRPKIMMLLAKAGFTQSYTYFTWRNTRHELTSYLRELLGMEKEYYRPNFFANTPDILPFYLQQSGRPGFIIRITLAATLASNYGIYSGFELCEAEALPGKEEYKDSEKYEIKERNWNKEGNINDFITRLNHIRKENPALQHFKNLHFYHSSNENVIFYGKKMGTNSVFVAVNLDPHNAHETWIEMPREEEENYLLEDLLLGHSWEWRGRRQHLLLDPVKNPVAIFREKESG